MLHFIVSPSLLPLTPGIHPMWVPAKLLQSCLTLCNPMDCSPPCSFVHGILQARILEVHSIIVYKLLVYHVVILRMLYEWDRAVCDPSRWASLFHASFIPLGSIRVIACIHSCCLCIQSGIQWYGCHLQKQNLSFLVQEGLSLCTETKIYIPGWHISACLLPFLSPSHTILLPLLKPTQPVSLCFSPGLASPTLPCPPSPCLSVSPQRGLACTFLGKCCPPSLFYCLFPPLH